MSWGSNQFPIQCLKPFFASIRVNKIEESVCASLTHMNNIRATFWAPKVATIRANKIEGSIGTSLTHIYSIWDPTLGAKYRIDKG